MCCYDDCTAFASPMATTADDNDDEDQKQQKAESENESKDQSQIEIIRFVTKTAALISTVANVHLRNAKTGPGSEVV